LRLIHEREVHHGSKEESSEEEEKEITALRERVLKGK
jgi:hypothetical protein